ncbi:F-box/LRR-repeat protein 13 isoform X1 [Lactuca sativa]|uniref:At1g61320/AtMIF1 LRR domain-containing protein n=1 Tax=Lactuca sativa TaxID=4236 RepID=A0A9R1VP96_LACSA|nr:F-box/LRR-repeat protein 13 isoform X1 [Lactuca sativa]KAJ0208377.1 hypothetical protein LSAT_V11C500255650 [Lactuca sativa]
MKKSERPKALKREDGVDFISSMPDAILVLILSRLFFTKETIRSSILSSRWRYLWTAVPSIHIHYEGKLKKNEFKEFLYWVFVNKSVDLNSFRLCCSNYYSMSTVGRWIHAAVTRNVKQLELTLCPNQNYEDIEMPHCLVTSGSVEVLELNLSRRGLKLPNIMGFPSLRVLELECVDLLEDDNLVKRFLESCPLLEELSLDDCIINKLGVLCISCLKLKKLTIFNGNEDEGLCGSIKVSCPKLVHLDITGHLAYNLYFECLNSLKEAAIDPELEGNIRSVLFPGISQVESLLTDIYFFSQCINAARDPSLPKLKTLVLTTTIDAFNFSEFIRILKYYPKLESLKLVIKKQFYGREEWELHEGDRKRIMTPDLKSAEFFEFKGEKPKLVSDWDEVRCLEMVFSWGKKVTFFY